MLEATTIAQQWLTIIGQVPAATPLFGLIGLVLTLIGLVFAGWYVLRWLLLRRLLGPEQLAIEPDRVRLGDTLTIRYGLPIKRNVRIELAALELICREWVQYRRGTKVYRDQHEVFNQPQALLQDAELTGGQTVAGEVLLAVPPTAMHSLRAKNNRIDWFVRMEVRIPKCPNVRKERPIIVLPLLAPQAAAAQESA